MGGDYEHIAFLSSQALELQGEVTKAFLHALIPFWYVPLKSSKSKVTAKYTINGIPKSLTVPLQVLGRKGGGHLTITTNVLSNLLLSLQFHS